MRLPPGPARSRSRYRATASASPSTIVSTLPSERLRTHPVTPASPAARSAKNRNPTPWTRPVRRTDGDDELSADRELGQERLRNFVACRGHEDPVVGSRGGIAVCPVEGLDRDVVAADRAQGRRRRSRKLVDPFERIDRARQT